MRITKSITVFIVILVLSAYAIPYGFALSSNAKATGNTVMDQKALDNMYKDLAAHGMSAKDIYSIRTLHIIPPSAEAQYAPLLSVKGRVFVDANNNGIYDNGERGIPGVTIQIYQRNILIVTQVTNSEGFYGFVTPRSAAWTLVERIPAGYVGTTPSTVQLNLNPSRLPVTVNFGCVKTSSIVGMEYYDANINGRYDPGDRGLSGWTVTLRRADGSSTTIRTDRNGRFGFNNLRPGQYTISERVQSGYTSTSPSSMTFTLGQGQTVNVTSSNGLFGSVLTSQMPGSVVGLKYNDLNGNGQYNPGEPGLPGWTIRLNNSSGTVGTAVTGSNGSFRFNNLRPGQYLISEVPQPGFANTSPTSRTITVTALQTLNVTTSCNLFGNRPTTPATGSIVGLKYNDTNGSGQYYWWKPPLSGWTITLTNSSGTVGTQTTGSNGSFQFTNLAPGQYTLSETLQPGYVNTSPSTLALTLAAGQTLNATIIYGAFGNSKFATIQGIKYLDANLNGTYDPGETPLQGWTINLTNSNGLVGTRTTDSNGFFQFTNLVPGQYTLSEVVQPGYTNTSAKTMTVTPRSGQTINVTDSFGAFGNVQLATIEGIKYLDANQNKTYDPGETPLQGWAINLTNNSGLVGTQITDANGFFQFTGLVPGQYTVYEVLQAGYVNTSPTTFTVTLASGDALNITNSSGAFGNIQLATIQGIKYLDANLNGTYDPGETPLQGWTINLTNSSGLVGSVVTDTGGFFRFTNLVPGQYTVSEIVQPGYTNTSLSSIIVTLGSGESSNVTVNFGAFGNVQFATIFGIKYLDVNLNGTYDNGDTPLAGWTINLTNSSGLAGTNVTDASGQFQFNNLLPGQYTLSEEVQAGYTNTSADTLTLTLNSGDAVNVTNTFGAFGNIQLANIQGIKYLDANLNGTYDPGETPLQGWAINLTNNSGLVGTQITDANGFFQFGNLVPGQYTVSEIVRPGYTNTSLSSVTVTVGSGESSNVTVNFGAFGNVQFATIYGIKYLDVNLNGTYDNGDTPLPGWTINLTSTSGPIGSVVTDGSGSFQFNNLLPGQYTLSEEVQPGYMNTSVNTLTLTLNSGDAVNVTNTFGAFGNIQLATIKGIKYLDANQNSTLDPGEMPLSDWTINLTNTSGLVGSVQTDANGSFQFNNLVPGQYTLSEEVQPGYMNTSAKTLAIILTSGLVLNVTDTFGAFGNIQLATIQGVKYLDVNQNRTYDPGETPLAGWTINLTNSSGLVGTNVTNANGQFMFTSLVPGQYTISEVLQPGYANTSVQSLTVTLTSGQVLNVTVSNGAFGNIQLATIQGIKYLDTNRNGTYDPGEKLLSGWTINLTNTSGLVGTNVTNANGQFQFSNLVPGQYTISEVVPAGYANTSARIRTVTLQSGQNLNVTQAFGLFGNRRIGLVYVANAGSNNVTVVDNATNTVIASIHVGISPFGVAVTPDGTRVYVTNQGNNTVSVINTATNTVLTNIPVGTGPTGVAVTPDGTRVYVTNQGNNTVSVINTATNTVSTTIGTGIGNNPFGLAVTPDGTRVYVANQGSNNVSVISTATNTVTATIIVGTAPTGVAVRPDGARVYVTNLGSNTVSVINTANNNVISTIGVGTSPHGIAITPDGSKAYVANRGSTSVAVFNPTNNILITTIGVGPLPTGVAVIADGTRVYVTNNGGNSVSVINTATNTVSTTIVSGIGNGPIGVAAG